MTPKEKAEELYNKFVYCLPDSGDISKQDIQECALIAVNEMLDFRNRLYLNEGSLAHQYLLEVKQEIEKL